MKVLVLRSVVLGLLLLCFASSTWAIDRQVGPGEGVAFFQTDFAANQLVQDTATGVALINLVLLRLSAELPNGYLNIATPAGWVIRNLPIFDVTDYPYINLSVLFALAVSSGTNVSTLDAAVVYSDLPKQDFSPGQFDSFPVEPTTVAIGGVPGAEVTAPPTPPNLTDILFGDQSQNDTVIQFDHPNIEAAKNQCMPASVANSLQFLEDTTDLDIPHEHKAGLRGDDSLVGKLGEAMDRTVTDRNTGSGTWGLSGKLKYLAENGLQGRVETIHWGSGANSGADDVSVDAGGNTATATGGGTDIPFDTVLDKLREGQDCEMVYSWPTGAHAVDLVAAGTTGEQKWLVHASDLNQSSDSAGAGASGFRFEYLNDPDEDGKLNLSGTNKEITQVICEKFVPPPPTISIIDIFDPAGHGPFVVPPPEDLLLETDGPSVLVTGSAPWLPMTGELNPSSGAFSATSTGTVAGFQNVTSTFVGTAVNGEVEGTITLGSNGGLPTGQPISYDLQISTPSSDDARLAIRANGFRHQIVVPPGDPLQLALGKEAGTQQNQSLEWWLVATASAVPGQLFHFDLNSGDWQSGLAPSFVGPVPDLGNVPLWVLGSIPPGEYVFYFGFDETANGQLDLNSLQYDSVQVDVE